jgi:hypothetical protein
MSRSSHRKTSDGLRLIGAGALALCLLLRMALAPSLHTMGPRGDRKATRAQVVLDSSDDSDGDDDVTPALERPPGGPNATPPPPRLPATREKVAASRPGMLAPLAVLPERSSRSAKAIEVLSRHRHEEGGTPGSSSTG